MQYAALAEFLSLINNLIVQMLKFRFKFDKMSINDKKQIRNVQEIPVRQLQNCHRCIINNFASFKNLKLTKHPPRRQREKALTQNCGTLSLHRSSGIVALHNQASVFAMGSATQPGISFCYG